MSHAQSEQRNNSKSDGGIAVLWLILYVIGLLDILAFKPVPKADLALATPEQSTHASALTYQAD